MKLKYTKITNKRYKFFYEESGKYGEFYIEMENGEAEIFAKDSEYALPLIIGFAKAMEGGEQNGKN